MRTPAPSEVGCAGDGGEHGAGGEGLGAHGGLLAEGTANVVMRGGQISTGPFAIGGDSC